jgi:hypothetical protein
VESVAIKAATMAKMKAAMATVRERMSNIYKADMLETCKEQDSAKG